MGPLLSHPISGKRCGRHSPSRINLYNDTAREKVNIPYPNMSDIHELIPLELPAGNNQLTGAGQRSE